MFLGLIHILEIKLVITGDGGDSISNKRAIDTDI